MVLAIGDKGSQVLQGEKGLDLVNSVLLRRIFMSSVAGTRKDIEAYLSVHSTFALNGLKTMISSRSDHARHPLANPQGMRCIFWLGESR